jgi:hypothetical protein
MGAAPAANRCRVAAAGASCDPEGTTCGFAGECCHGPCLPVEGAFVCGLACVDDGAFCTTASDCCDTTSECLRLASNLVCAQPLR